VLVVARLDRRPSYEEAEQIARAVGAPEGAEPEVRWRWLTFRNLPAQKVQAVVFSWRELPAL
jgi:hypothetical protein